MARRNRRRPAIEMLENRRYMAADVYTAGTVEEPAADIANDAGYFIADSFSFGVEREMKESGEKGGTEDINIGVGELQERARSLAVDSALANGPDGNGYFVADSFSFGVEREMKESG